MSRYTNTLNPDCFKLVQSPPKFTPKTPTSSPPITQSSTHYPNISSINRLNTQPNNSLSSNTNYQTSNNNTNRQQLNNLNKTNTPLNVPGNALESVTSSDDKMELQYSNVHHVHNVPAKMVWLVEWSHYKQK